MKLLLALLFTGFSFHSRAQNSAALCTALKKITALAAQDKIASLKGAAFATDYSSADKLFKSSENLPDMTENFIDDSKTGRPVFNSILDLHTTYQDEINGEIKKFANKIASCLGATPKMNKEKDWSISGDHFSISIVAKNEEPYDTWIFVVNISHQ